MYLPEATRPFRVMWLATLGTGGLIAAALYARAGSVWGAFAIACWGIWMLWMSFSYLNRKWVTLEEAIERNMGQLELLAGLIEKRGSGLTIWTRKVAEEMFEKLGSKNSAGETVLTGRTSTKQEQLPSS